MEYLKQAIKERIKAACRRPWMWLRRNRGTQQQEPASSEITITQTVTQVTTPLISLDGESERLIRARTPSLLTINSAVEFSPSGSPAGAALGIPAEHILDENPSRAVEPIHLIVSTSSAPVTPARTNSSHSDSNSESTPSEGSRLNGSKSNPFVDVPRVQFAEDQSQSQSNTTPTAQVSAEPAVAPNDDADADTITAAPPLDQNPSASAPIAGTAYSFSSCGLCRERYYNRRVLPSNMVHLELRERKAYLPCGHCFGHRCLHNWMIRAHLHGGPIRCPRGCISLRHNCGHLAMPTCSRPDRRYRNFSSATIPWACEFC